MIAYVGAPFLFTFPQRFGNNPSSAMFRMVSIGKIVQDSQTPTNEMINPPLIKTAPHFPTIISKTYPIAGCVSIPCNSCIDIVPYGSIETRTYTMINPKIPRIVAFPTSDFFLAREPTTEAPSIPTNTHNITMIQLNT